MTQDRALGSNPSPRPMAGAGDRFFTLLPLLLLAFAACAWFGIQLTRHEGRLAVLWIANGVAVAGLLQFPARRWLLALAAVGVSNMLVNLSFGDPPAVALGITLCNLLEIASCAVAIRHIGGEQPDLEDFGRFLRVLFMCAVVAPLLSAVAFFLLFGLPGHAPIGTAIGWYASDALGLAMVAPILIMAFRAIRRPARSVRRAWIEMPVTIAAIAAVSAGIFAQHSYPLLFLICPMMIVAAFRLNVVGVGLAMAVVALISAIGTSLGLGPIALVHGLKHQLFILQIFLAVTFLSALPLSVALEQRRRLTRALGESEAARAATLDNIREVVFSADHKGNWTFLNRAWEELTGWSVAHSLGRSLTEAVHPDDLETIRARLRRAIDRDEPRSEVVCRLLRRDGGFRWIEATLRMHYDARDGFSGTTGTIRDITAQKEHEAELLAARDSAEAAVQAKASFLANMSHEIRTPMNGVIGFTDLLLDSELDPEQRRQAQLIADSGRAMLRLLNDILDLSKIDAGAMEVAHDVVDLPHTLSACRKLLMPAASAKGLDFTYHYDPDLPQYVIGDGLRLRQIILNLLGNAIKFTERGGVTLRARLCDGELPMIRISVMDTGVGIAADKLETIFGEFVQAEATTARRYGGTGLGLAISRRLASLMQGTIEVQSEPGVGTRFDVIIPLDPAEAPDNVAPERQEEPLRGTGPVQVLVVEDFDVNQELMVQMLRRIGASAHVLGTGSAALNHIIAAAQSGSLPDLVLMDIQMPGMDGLEATRCIRAAGIGPDRLPIVALTANAYMSDVEECLAAGMQAHLAKPVRASDLARAVAAWTRRGSESEDEPGAWSPPPAEAPAAPAPEQAAPEQKATGSLTERYAERKRLMLERIAFLMRTGVLDGAALEEIAAMAHKLAGTAGMFGEAALGEQAALLEDGIAQWDGPDRDARLMEAVAALLRAA